MCLDIEVEEPASWPDEVRRRVSKDRSLILAFQNEYSRIEKLQREDVSARINVPHNPYEDAYEQMLEELNTLLVPHRIVGFHCTRLTPREMQDVRTSGLRVLSPALVMERLSNCHADGHIANPLFETLRSSPQVAASLSDRHGVRTGMIWFCPNRSTLRDGSAVSRFFRHWGGEAVYVGHEQEIGVATLLRRIGSPCIVRCAIPFARARRSATSYAARFVAQSISAEFECPEPPAHFDLRSEEDVPASDVREIIPYPASAFEQLTGCSTWSEKERMAGS